jgi:exodeoxyribonuclease VIII
MSDRMTFAEYRAIDAVNWSSLKSMKDSPAHYLAAVKEGRADSAALITGRLLDCLIFEPDEFATRYVISPYDDFRTKEAKAWRDEQVAEVVKADALAESQALADAVRRHPVARRYLDAGRFQVPLLWTDPATGLACKGLADLIGPGFLIDGKSARTIDKRRYASQAGSLLYHCQLAHYRAGMRIGLGIDPEFIGHIVYEKGAPYDVAVFEFAPAVIDSGEVIVRELLNRVAECEAPFS